MRDLERDYVALLKENKELKQSLSETLLKLAEQMKISEEQAQLLAFMDSHIQENIGRAAVTNTDDRLEIAFPAGARRVIGESQGYTPLPVLDATFDCPVNGPNTPVMITAWFPTSRQIEKMKAGAPLSVQLLGTQHPPIVVAVGEAP